MNNYIEMKKRQAAEVHAFPMFFAFGKKQLAEGMSKLGLTETDTDQICSIGAGGYIKKSDLPKFKEMLKGHREERRAAIQADRTGDGFIYKMFLVELSNHDFGYTQDYEETLDALGYTYEDLEDDPRLSHGIEKAAAHIGGNGGF